MSLQYLEKNKRVMFFSGPQCMCSKQLHKQNNNHQLAARADSTGSVAALLLGCRTCDL